MISNIASFPHLNVRRAQSKTPSNLASSFPCFSSSFWFCTRSLTRSIGAADVFEMAAAVPERKKFSAKPSFLLPEDILSNVDALADGVSIQVVGDIHMVHGFKHLKNKAHFFSGHLSWFLRLLLIMMRCSLYEATLLINLCSECISRELEQVELAVSACGRAGGPQLNSATTYDKQDFTFHHKWKWRNKITKQHKVGLQLWLKVSYQLLIFSWSWTQLIK